MSNKIYLAFCERYYRAKLAAAEVKPAGIRRVESRGKVREFVRGFQI